MVAIVYGAYPSRDINGIYQATDAVRQATGSIIDYFGNIEKKTTKTAIKLPATDSDVASGTAVPDVGRPLPQVDSKQ